MIDASAFGDAGYGIDVSGYSDGFGAAAAASAASIGTGVGASSGVGLSNGYDANGQWSWTDEFGLTYSLPFGWTGTMQGGQPVAAASAGGRGTGGFLNSVGEGARIGGTVGTLVPGIGTAWGAAGGALIGALTNLFGDGQGGTVAGSAFDVTAGGRSGSATTDTQSTATTPSDSGPTVGDTSNPTRPLTQPPSLTPQSPRPATPAPAPETPAPPALPVPTPDQAVAEQEAELERVEQQAKDEERRRRAALRAYLNPTGPSGLRAKPLVGRPRLLGD